MLRPALLTLWAAAILAAQQPTLVIPHIADGAGWRTTISVFNRINTEPVRLSILFRDAEGRRMPLTLEGFGGVSSLELDLPVQGAIYLETTGASPSVQTGWAEVRHVGGTSPVTGFALFRQTVPGRPDFEAVSNGMRGAAALTFPFDNTNGLVTGFAMANLTQADCTIAVSAIFDEFGVPISTAARPIGFLAPQGHTSFVSTDRMPELANRRGHLTFAPLLRCGPEGFVTLGLRFNPTGPFTNLLPLSVTAP